MVAKRNFENAVKKLDKDVSCVYLYYIKTILTNEYGHNKKIVKCHR